MSDSVCFVLPAAMAAHTGGIKRFEAEANSLRDALSLLISEFPDLKPHLLDADGNLQPFVNLFADDRQVIDLDDPGLQLEAGSELLIVSALAGG